MVQDCCCICVEKGLDERVVIEGPGWVFVFPVGSSVAPVEVVCFILEEFRVLKVEVLEHIEYDSIFGKDDLLSLTAVVQPCQLLKV